MKGWFSRLRLMGQKPKNERTTDTTSVPDYQDDPMYRLMVMAEYQPLIDGLDAAKFNLKDGDTLVFQVSRNYSPGTMAQLRDLLETHVEVHHQGVKVLLVQKPCMAAGIIPKRENHP